MITINTYTGNWQSAVQSYHKTVRPGTMVRIHVSADGREYDDFHRALKEQGLEAEIHVRWMPRAKVDVYLITKVGKR